MLNPQVYMWLLLVTPAPRTAIFTNHVLEAVASISNGSKNPQTGILYLDAKRHSAILSHRTVGVREYDLCINRANIFL